MSWDCVDLRGKPAGAAASFDTGFEVSSIVCDAVGTINAPPEQRMEPFNPAATRGLETSVAVSYRCIGVWYGATREISL